MTRVGIVGCGHTVFGRRTDATVQEIGLGPGIEGLMEAIVDSGLRAQAGMCLMDAGEGAPPGLVGDTDDVLARTEDLGAGLTAGQFDSHCQHFMLFDATQGRHSMAR